MRSYAISFSLYFIIAILGISWFHVYKTFHLGPIEGLSDNYKNVKAILVVNSYSKTSNKISFKAKLIALENESIRSPINVECYIDSSDYLILHPKDTIQALINLNKSRSPKNKYAFDYARYLSFEHVHYQAWISKIDRKIINQNYSWIEKISIQFRQKALDILSQKLNEDRNAIAAAILLGDRSRLNKDIQKQFANSGAIHVLAVSGLHVGIVIMVLSWLLKWMPNDHQFLSNVRNLIILFCIALYALLTGMAPPVIRSTLIFALLISGKIINRQSNSLNLLAGAALIMLLFNPFNLFKLSFQLSFIAVSSILIFYPKISKLYHPHFLIDKYIWSLIAMSISAQILIIPISLFYFHQFPIYFIISSVAVIILATFLILLGAGVIFLSLWGINIQLLDSAFSWVSQSMLDITSEVNALPNSVIKVMWYSSPHFVLLFMAIISISVFLYKKSVHQIYFSLSCIISFLTLSVFTLFNQKSQVTFSDYEKDEKISDVIIGQRAYQIHDKVLTDQKTLFITKDFRHAHGVKEVITDRDALLKIIAKK